jgi:hypothetical protein
LSLPAVLNSAIVGLEATIIRASKEALRSSDKQLGIRPWCFDDVAGGSMEALEVTAWKIYFRNL